MSEETADAEEERRSKDQRGRNPVEKAERAGEESRDPVREQNPVKRAGIRWRKQESGEESRDSVREQNTVKKARTDKHS